VILDWSERGRHSQARALLCPDTTNVQARIRYEADYFHFSDQHAVICNGNVAEADPGRE
jgi:hypothetical protein